MLDLYLWIEGILVFMFVLLFFESLGRGGTAPTSRDLLAIRDDCKWKKERVKEEERQTEGKRERERKKERNSFIKKKPAYLNLNFSGMLHSGHRKQYLRVGRQEI